MRNKETVEECMLYRKAMRVEEIILLPGNMYDFNVKDAYPICPRCGVSMEYEYINYCGFCGQKLSWKGYSKASIRYAGKK